MYAERHLVTITTDADGDGVGYTPEITGRVVSIQYVKPSSGGYADGVDFTIVGETTSQGLWTKTNVDLATTVAPRQATHTTAGVAALYATGGTAVLDYVVLAKERVKITVASGGNAAVGSFYVTVA
jgi:hypothetical protein